jgi:hypothetical protein
MNKTLKITFVLFLFVCGPVFAAVGKSLADIVSPEKRRVTVDLAVRLARAPEPAPLPAELAQPFNPSNFDQPDPDDLRAAAAAAGRANATGTPSGAKPPPVDAPRPAGDREILETIAARILPTGTMKISGEPLLTFGRKNVKIGSRFTVTNPANGQEYELELIAIDSTTFSLRYRNEEITRPIKSGKSP